MCTSNATMPALKPLRSSLPELRPPRVLVAIAANATFGTSESQNEELVIDQPEYDEKTWICKPQRNSCLLRALASAKMLKSFKAALSEGHPWSKTVRNVTLRSILHSYNVPGAGTSDFGLDPSVDEIVDSKYKELVDSPTHYKMAVELIVPSDASTPAADVHLPDAVLHSMSLCDYHRDFGGGGRLPVHLQGRVFAGRNRVQGNPRVARRAQICEGGEHRRIVCDRKAF